MESNTYGPKIKEIAKRTTKEMGNDTLKYGKAFFGEALHSNTILYDLPTVFRKGIGGLFHEFKSKGEEIAGSIGFMLGYVVGGIAQVELYKNLMDKTELPLWAIPIATNVISGIYEAGRAVHKKYIENKKKLTSEHSKKSLEESL